MKHYFRGIIATFQSHLLRLSLSAQTSPRRHWYLRQAVQQEVGRCLLRTRQSAVSRLKGSTFFRHGSRDHRPGCRRRSCRGSPRGGPQERDTRSRRERHGSCNRLRNPGRTVRGCPFVVSVQTILDPFPDVAVHIVEAERIGSKRADGSGLHPPTGCRSRCNWHCPLPISSPHE